MLKCARCGATISEKGATCVMNLFHRNALKEAANKIFHLCPSCNIALYEFMRGHKLCSCNTKLNINNNEVIFNESQD